MKGAIAFHFPNKAVFLADAYVPRVGEIVRLDRERYVVKGVSWGLVSQRNGNYLMQGFVNLEPEIDREAAEAREQTK